MAWLYNTVILSLKLIFLLQEMVKLLKISCNGIIFKDRKQILKMTTMASKKIHRNFKEFNVLFD